MKNWMRLTLIFSLVAMHLSAAEYDDDDEMDEPEEEKQEQVYDTRSYESQSISYAEAWGSGAEEGAYDSLDASMVGWGLGLAVAIALISGVIASSTSPNGTTGSTHAHSNLVN